MLKKRLSFKTQFWNGIYNSCIDPTSELLAHARPVWPPSHHLCWNTSSAELGLTSTGQGMLISCHTDDFLKGFFESWFAYCHYRAYNSYSLTTHCRLGPANQIIQHPMILKAVLFHLVPQHNLSTQIYCATHEWIRVSFLVFACNLSLHLSV